MTDPSVALLAPQSIKPRPSAGKAFKDTPMGTSGPAPFIRRRLAEENDAFLRSLPCRYQGREATSVEENSEIKEP